MRKLHPVSPNESDGTYTLIVRTEDGADLEYYTSTLSLFPILRFLHDNEDQLTVDEVTVTYYRGSDSPGRVYTTSELESLLQGWKERHEWE